MNAMTAMSTTSIWVHFFSLFFFLGPVSHSPRNGTGFHLSSHTESVLDRSIGRSVTVDAGDAARCHWQWARRVFFCSWWLPLSLCLNVHDGISVMTHDRPPEASWVLTPHVALAASPSPPAVSVRRSFSTCRPGSGRPVSCLSNTHVLIVWDIRSI